MHTWSQKTKLESLPPAAHMTLQRKADSALPGLKTSAPPLVHEVLRSPGQPLEASTRAFMEPRFSHDFSQVRVHRDARSAESASAVNARAYTVGQDVVFGTGQYAPATPAGQRLLAHELTHVVQQGGAGGKGGSLSVSAPDDAGEREAGRVSHSIFSNGVNPAVQSLAAPSLQRDPIGKDKDPIHTPLIDDYRKQHDLLPGGKDEFGQPAGPSDAQIKYGGNPGGSAAKPAPPPAAAGDPLLATATRTVATYPVDKQGNIKGMNIDVISKLVFQELTSSQRAYIVVRGSYPKGDTDFDPTRPGETARSALIQWIGKGTIKDIDQRIEAQYGDSGPLPPNNGGSIEIEVRYKPVVISNPPLTGLPATASASPKPKTAAAGGPDPLATTYDKPYPGGAGDVFSAFMKTPMGEKFKEMGKKELKTVWDKTSVPEKIVILVNILATLGIASYGLAKMPANQQKAIVDLIISDDDKALQIPLKEKGFSLFEMDFDANFKPKKIRPPIGEIELK